MRIVHNVKLSCIIYPFRQQCLRFGSQLARPCQADRGVRPERQKLLLAVETVGLAPEPRAGRRNLNKQATTIRYSIGLVLRDKRSQSGV